MRTIIDLPEEDVSLLDELRKQSLCSRAALIREAVAEYLAERRPMAEQKAQQAVYGLWKGKKVDGLAYQDSLRAEW